MRPLPRLLAFADDRIAALDDLGTRAAAIAAAGPAVGLVARRPGGSADELAALAERFAALATPPMATVLVTGRADIALSVRASGVILREGDLDIGDVRAIVTKRRDRTLFVFRSVHTDAEARAAVEAGADALIAGSIWPTATHAGRAAAGTDWLERVVSLGVPTYAIGGVTVERAAAAKAAGAWGVAAITTIWEAPQPYTVAMQLVQPWMQACN